MFDARYHVLSSFERFVLRLSPCTLRSLLDHADLSSVLLLSRASRALYWSYTEYARSVWNPDGIYRRWFAQPWLFHRLLRRCGAILSGSIVFDFFDRIQRKGNIMHMYLRAAGADEACGWLSGQGYASICGGYNPSEPLWHGLHCLKAVKQRGEQDGPVLATYLFEKIVVTERGTIEAFLVKVTVVDIDPIQHLLFDFYSTGEMNFFTSDGAVSIFPYDTFVNRISYASWKGNEIFDKAQTPAMNHDEHELRIISDGVKGMRPGFRTGAREVLDKSCWYIPFQENLFPQFEEGYFGPICLNIPFEVLFLSDVENDALFKLKVAEPYIWRTLLTDAEEVEDDEMYF